MSRFYVPTSIPEDGVNQRLLQDQLDDLGDIAILYSTVSGWRIEVIDESITNAQIQGVIDSHDATVKTAGQQRAEEKDVLFNQVNGRFIEEVIKDTPDWATAYADIASMVAGKQAVLNALTNIIDLQNDVNLLTGIIPGSNRAKKQQLVAFIQVLSLWSTVD